MRHTLLLVFLHGFKGGETTFGPKYRFAQDLRAVVAERLPRIDVRVLVYPKYETRGDLAECVTRFREWLVFLAPLQPHALINKVVDLEVRAGAPSPTVHPSVRTVLIGHSMGGIVAVETAVGLASELPIGGDGHATDEEPASLNGLMFPYIQGVLGFDTPFLGISPGVVAFGAEDQYTKASAALSQLGQLRGLVWGATETAKPGPASSKSNQRLALPAPPLATSQVLTAAAPANELRQTSGSASVWGRWGKVALAAGAAGALAAGGAAAYLGREHLTAGWTWGSSHLEFVGCLARPEEMKLRVARMVRLQRELSVGFANVYTRLGRGADAAAGSSESGGRLGSSIVGRVLGADRTFCNLPSRTAAGTWMAAVNEKATDETVAHMTMFEEPENPGYNGLVKDASELVVGWVQDEWYKGSSALQLNNAPANSNEPG